MSERLDKAITFAMHAHSGQTRKSGLPYMLHPMEAAAIAGGIANDEDVICAALLHDVVEDAGVELNEIEAQFGKRVAFLVDSETENKRRERPAGETWLVRKQESFDKLTAYAASDEGVKALWLSDKLSNIRAFYAKWSREGDRAFEMFHQKDKAMQKWYYVSVLELLSSLEGTCAYREYKRLVEEIFA